MFGHFSIQRLAAVALLAALIPVGLLAAPLLVATLVVIIVAV
jgi:hypothetical protein